MIQGILKNILGIYLSIINIFRGPSWCHIIICFFCPTRVQYRNKNILFPKLRLSSSIEDKGNYYIFYKYFALTIF